jgi:3-oxoacyl-[acyl-carrier protein] reductase
MKRALVTGGARGIGRAIAARFAAEDYTVTCPTRAELDLSDFEQIEAFLERCDAFDVLVNNAGENELRPVADVNPEALRRIIAVNEVAPFLLMRGLGSRMAERGGGRIVNVSSVYSMVGRVGRSMYTTTKSALNGATIAFAVELGPMGVLVNAICPGFIDTELTRRNNTPAEIDALCEQVSLRRLGTAEEVADLVFYLGSERNTYITGQIVAVDGGFLNR